jgi:hypothetical protein
MEVVNFWHSSPEETSSNVGKEGIGLTPVRVLRLWALGAGIERVIAVCLSILSNT